MFVKPAVKLREGFKKPRKAAQKPSFVSCKQCQLKVLSDDYERNIPAQQQDSRA